MSQNIVKWVLFLILIYSVTGWCGQPIDQSIEIRNKETEEGLDIRFLLKG